VTLPMFLNSFSMDFAFHWRLHHAAVGYEPFFAPIGLICQDPHRCHSFANGTANLNFAGFLDRKLTVFSRVRPLRRLRSLQAPLR
jgi:hypothetical protein